jgi:hypothetical protein
MSGGDLEQTVSRPPTGRDLQRSHGRDGRSPSSGQRMNRHNVHVLTQTQAAGRHRIRD